MGAESVVTSPTEVGSAVLRCTGLHKAFGSVVAVDGLSFEVPPGMTYGLLGPNGAGKTTTILMAAGILTPDDGVVEVAGRHMTVRATQAKRAIGYVPQETAVYPDLTARENLRLFARLYGLSRSRARTRIGEVLELIGLADRAGDLTRTYSGGMLRRLNIGIGLLHRPRLLILDEPTVGVDPQSRNAILDSIQALSGEGMAVLYTTHYMEEAERLCQRVGIMDRGLLIAEGTPRELRLLVDECDQVRLEATGDLPEAADALRRLPSMRQVDITATGLQLLDTDARTALPSVLGIAAEHGAVVRSVTVAEPDLEAVFLHLTGKSLRD